MSLFSSIFNLLKTSVVFYQQLFEKTTTQIVLWVIVAIALIIYLTISILELIHNFKPINQSNDKKNILNNIQDKQQIEISENITDIKQPIDTIKINDEEIDNQIEQNFDMQFDLETLSGEDVNVTKLDLARAFIEIGEKVKAEELFRSVLASQASSEKVKEEAISSLNTLYVDA